MHRFRDQNYIDSIISGLPLSESQFLYCRDVSLNIGDRLRFLIYVVRSYNKSELLFNSNHVWYRNSETFLKATIDSYQGLKAQPKDFKIDNSTIFRRLISLPLALHHIPELNYGKWTSWLRSRSQRFIDEIGDDHAKLYVGQEISHGTFLTNLFGSMMEQEGGNASSNTNQMKSMLGGMMNILGNLMNSSNSNQSIDPDLSTSNSVSNLGAIQDTPEQQEGNIPGNTNQMISILSGMFGNLEGLMNSNQNVNLEMFDDNSAADFMSAIMNSDLQDVIEEPDLNIDLDIGADESNNIDLSDLGIIPIDPQDWDTSHGIGELSLEDLQ